MSFVWLTDQLLLVPSLQDRQESEVVHAVQSQSLSVCHLHLVFLCVRCINKSESGCGFCMSHFSITLTHCHLS
jgi:hypothetical protein